LAFAFAAMAPPPGHILVAVETQEAEAGFLAKTPRAP